MPDSPIAPDAIAEGKGVATPATSLLLEGSSMAKGKQRDTFPGIPGSLDTPLRFQTEGPESSSELDEDVLDWADLQMPLKLIWEKHRVFKNRRQEWIIQRSRNAVLDYEARRSEPFSRTEFHRLWIAGADSLAEQCAEASRRKLDSRASTPLPNTRTKVTNTPKGTMIFDHHPAPPEDENREDQDEARSTRTDNDEMTPQPNPDAIAQTIAEAGDAPWKERYEKMLRREGEIKMFGFSNIPDQGIIFDGFAPVDEWKHPQDAARVRAKMAADAGRTPTSRSSSPPPVPMKDNRAPRRTTTGSSMGPTINRDDYIAQYGHSPISAPYRPAPPTPIPHRISMGSRSGAPMVTAPVTINPSRATTAIPTRQTRIAAPMPVRTPRIVTQRRAQPQTRPTPQPRAHPGYEMPSVVDPTNHITGLRGITEAKENHRSTMKDRLTKIIDDTIGYELAFPDGYKPSFKADRGDPKKYDGSPKMTDLEDWLSAIVCRFALQRLGGDRPEIDRVRVMLLMDCLDGTAYKWMLRHVTHVNRRVEHWTFLDVIHGLYDRFVHPSSMQDARENLNKVEYSPKDGIQGMYDNMQEHAGGMAVYPDDYTMLSIFLDKIPSYLMTELLNTRGLTPEVNTLSEFVANALDIEQRKKNETYYRERRVKATPTRTYKNTKANDEPKKQAPDHGTKVVERNTNRFPRNNNYSKNYAQNRKPFVKAKIQDKTNDNVIPKNDRAPPRSGKHKYQWSKEPFKPKESTSANKGCYNCGAPDHFSKECPKPRRDKSFVRAARSARASDSEDETEGRPSDDSNESEGGMPPISEGDEEDERDPNERIEIDVPMGSEYYEDDEHDDRMFAMRTKGELEYEAGTDFVTATVVFPLKGNDQTKDVKMRKHKLIPSRKTRMRPKYSEEEKRCLATWVEINDLRAWTLWDSGSTTTGITPAFAELAKIPVDELEDPHVLQLGTVGSRSAIKYGADVNINVEGEKMSIYVDIANFDRYEMIIGTPFMKRNKVLLDFDKNEVIINGKRIPAIAVSTKHMDPNARRQRATDKKKE